MPDLWIPDTYNRQGQLDVPLHDVTLANGLKLRFKGIMVPPDETLVGGMAAYQRDGLAVTASLDVTPRWGPLLHVCVSRHDRHPTWDEIHAVKDAFFGDDVDAMMVLPRAEDYVNIHRHAFHLWQTPEGWRLQ